MLTKRCQGYPQNTNIYPTFAPPAKTKKTSQPITSSMKVKKEKIKIITLGCSKNLVDSENIITQLRHNRFDVEHDSDSEDVDTVIINTCGFIGDAKEESIDTILQFAAAKNAGYIRKLYVTGCLSQRYKEDLITEIPEVDAFFGTLELPQLLAKFNVDYRHELIGERQPTTPVHYAYLKISEGCDRSCSFCAIPGIRGKHISRPLEDLVREARHLASLGVKELILIAQELTYYGVDIYKKRALPELMRRLADVDGIEWIRLHYAYPHHFPEGILEVMASEPKICRYLDIPLQHISDNVLRRMGRKGNAKGIRELLKRAKATVPGITLRTTFLVGFPGETEEDFQELLEFVKEMQFDRVGVFEYSHEENTPADQYEDNVPAAVKRRRASALMDIQRDISLQKNVDKIGQTLKVLFDRKEGDFFIGRTEFDSPEVDTEVLVEAKDNFVRVGDFANIEIIDAEEYDLIGRPK